MRREAETISISMFPFMSVLCAVIGVMMLLLILSLSTRVFDEQDSGMSANVSSQDGLSKDELRRLEQAIENTEQRLQLLTENRLALAKAHRQLRRRLAQKTDEIELPSAAPKGTQLGTTLGSKDVKVVPDREHSKTHKKPLYVEVDIDGATIYPARSRYEVRDLDDHESAFSRFFVELDTNKDEQYVVFLLHPNGVANHKAIMRILIERFPSPKKSGIRFDYGDEPFSSDWTMVLDEAITGSHATDTDSGKLK